MFRSVIAITLCLTALPVAGGGKPAIEVSRRVTRLVVPVLGAAVAMHRRDDERTRQAVEDALSPLLEKRARETDEALAVLLAFYIGEHFGEDLVCELVARGRKMLPVLKRYSGREVVLPGYIVSPNLTDRGAEYQPIILRIEAGAKCVRGS